MFWKMSEPLIISRGEIFPVGTHPSHTDQAIGHHMNSIVISMSQFCGGLLSPGAIIKLLPLDNTFFLVQQSLRLEFHFGLAYDISSKFIWPTALGHNGFWFQHTGCSVWNCINASAGLLNVGYGINDNLFCMLTSRINADLQQLFSFDKHRFQYFA
jgi:hypothetical protein